MISIYWELCRPFTLLAPFIGFISFALMGWSEQTQKTLLQSCFPILLGALSAALLNAASNIVNQYFDLEIDRINKPGRPLPAEKLSIQAAIVFCSLLYFLSFLLAYLVNRQFFGIVLFTAFITYAYSGPPWRTKRSWWLANLTIAIPRGCLLVVAGWTAVRNMWDWEPWLMGGIFGLFVLGAASTKDYSDMPGDQAGGCITLPLRFGVETSAKMISPFFVLPFLLLLLGALYGVFHAQTGILVGLSLWLTVWGVYVSYLILRCPSELTLEANHISWKHMYFILLVGQLGVAAAYLLA